MLTYILLGLVGLAVYLQIGRLIGKVSWWIWHHEKWNEGSLVSYLALLLFPNSYFYDPLPPPCVAFDTSTEYQAFIAFFWPLKCLFNALSLSIIFVAILFRFLLFGPRTLKNMDEMKRIRAETDEACVAKAVEAKIRALEALKAARDRDDERIRILEAELEVEEVLAPPTGDEEEPCDDKTVH